MNAIKGKIIVITGGTAGVGKSVAEMLQKENTVIVLSRSAENNGATSFACDVSDKKRVQEVFDTIGQLYGHIDILLNNAGYGISGATELIAEEAARKVIDVNFFGVLFCAQCALPYMAAGSRIANVSSVAGISPSPFLALYNSIKAAVTMLSASMRLETKAFGVDVTALCLGDIATDFAAHRDQFTATNERYGDAVAAVDRFVEHWGNEKKMPLDKAAAEICRVLAKKKTRYRHFIGNKYKVFNVINLFFPNTVMKLVAKICAK